MEEKPFEGVLDDGTEVKIETGHITLHRTFGGPDAMKPAMAARPMGSSWAAVREAIEAVKATPAPEAPEAPKPGA